MKKRFLACVLGLLLCVCCFVANAESLKLFEFDNFSAYYEFVEKRQVVINIPFISNQKIEKLDVIQACYDFNGKSISNKLSPISYTAIFEKDGYYYNNIELILDVEGTDLSGLRIVIEVNDGKETAELKLSEFGIKYKENTAEGTKKHVLTVRDIPMMLEKNTKGFSDRNFVMNVAEDFTVKAFRFSNGMKLDGVRINGNEFNNSNDINLRLKKGEILDLSLKYNDKKFQSIFTSFNILLDYQLSGEEIIRTYSFNPISFLELGEDGYREEFNFQLDKILRSGN